MSSLKEAALTGQSSFVISFKVFFGFWCMTWIIKKLKEKKVSKLIWKNENYELFDIKAYTTESY